MERPLRIAIIGSGPSGFYAAEALLKQKDVAVSIDLFDRLPTPYGLVRYGVAPDHQKIKSVTKIFEKLAQDARLRFLGNVELGKDISHQDLKAHYDAIVYTVGASSDRNLGIAGETLKGSHSATEFVAWYNGHPDAVNNSFDLTVEKVAVVGVGNVALDVSRILAKNYEELLASDIANHALEALKDSKVTDVYILGRRGPVQAKFTSKELREFGELVEADPVVLANEIELDAASAAALAEANNNIKKNLELLNEFLGHTSEGKPRRVHFRFLTSPVEILGTEKVEGIRIERNSLDENQNAVGTGEFETLDVGMVLRSVGYKGVPLASVPFDARRGVIPNQGGRVVDGDTVVAGEYVAGWVKRGPSGVVGDNRVCAVGSINLLLEDVANLPKVTNENAVPSSITKLLEERKVNYITFDDWQKLDALELEAGKATGRPRVKFTNVAEMLALVEKSNA